MKEKKRQEKLLQKKAEKLAAAEREKEILNKCMQLLNFECLSLQGYISTV